VAINYSGKGGKIMSKLVVLAIGGNSLIKDSSHISVKDQYQSVVETSRHLVEMLKMGHHLVITHGNGPQVGFILRRSELSSHELHMVPLDSCGADTQGAIGYNIQMAMNNEMRKAGISNTVATVVTQVLVDKDDPAFTNPSKPIGSFMDKEKAEKHQQENNWSVVEDAGRGYRRVVASPMPKEIIEYDAIKTLVDQNMVVVCVGGGGIPVIRDEGGNLVGAEAVIDKDNASSLLARQLHADLFVISTAVEKVYINFGKPDQKALDKITVAEAKQYIEEGHFAAGSMLPKIKAMIEFIEATGKEGLITDPEHLAEALAGETGTMIVP
jgi:carbamate kinase